MSNFGPQAGQPSRTRPPTMTVPQGHVIARYPTYALAQRAVDFLSDNRLPVQAVTIVGTDLRVVERVTGRLSYGRVALQGALSGAWFGLLIGILLSFGSGSASAGVVTAILLGAGFGLMFAVISYASTRGRRDFTSRSEIVAGEYQILCADALVAQASEMLARLPLVGAGVDQPPPPSPSAPAIPPPSATWPPEPGAPAPTSQPPWPPTPPAAPPASPPTAVPARPTGPTYGEMIDSQKRERLERERAEREAADRARAAARPPVTPPTPAPVPQDGPTTGAAPDDAVR